MTSGTSRRFLVAEAIRSRRTLVVRTISLLPRAGAGGEERRDRGHATERAGLLTGPETVLFAVGRDRRIHHGEGTPRAGHRIAAGREVHASLAHDALLRAGQERLD